MTELLKPEGPAQTVADLDRRLSIMEASERLGLNRVRFAHSTGPTYEPGTYGAYESGGSSNTWRNDAGATGAGYPQVTLKTGNKVLFIMNCFVINIAYNATPTWRCNNMYAGIGLDNAAPPVWTDPRMYRQYYNNNGGAIIANICFAVERNDIVPGEHQFGIWAWWTDTAPAAPTLPKMYEASLTVIPLDL